MNENKRNKTLKIILIISLAVIVITLIGVATVYGYYRSKVALIQYDPDISEDIEVPSSNQEDTNVFNVLLIGTDERTEDFSDNARADSVILLSLNKNTMKIHLVSFERAIGVPITDGQYAGQWDWLTHIFRYGGAGMVLQDIRDCFKVDVNRYVRVNFHTFEQLIDAVGGVDIELTQEEADGLNGKVETNARTHTEVYPGLNHLDGYDALQYSRIRYIDSDWQRIVRQRNVLEQVIKQVKDLSLAELNSLLDEVLPLIRSNLTEGEITNLLFSIAVKLPQITVEQMTIPAKGTYGLTLGLGGRELFDIDFETNAQILHDTLYGDTDK